MLLYTEMEELKAGDTSYEYMIVIQKEYSVKV